MFYRESEGAVSKDKIRYNQEGQRCQVTKPKDDLSLRYKHDHCDYYKHWNPQNESLMIICLCLQDVMKSGILLSTFQS